MATIADRRPMSIKAKNAQTFEPCSTAAELFASVPDCNYHVEMRPTFTFDNNFNMTEIPEKFSVCRTDTGDALGIVGPKYVPIQNADALSVYDPFTMHPDGPKWCRAWTLWNGAQFWAEAETPWQREVSKGDIVCLTLLVAKSHDGSKSLTARYAPRRLVCDNGLSLLDDVTAWMIRHTAGAAIKMEHVAENLGMIRAEFDKTCDLYERLARAEPTTEQVETVLRRLFPDTTSNRAELQRARVLDLAANGIGSELAGHRLTGWSLYNGVTELTDHHSNAKSDDESMRLNSIVFGSNARLKTDALETISQVLQLA